MTKIKLCGLRREEDVQAVNDVMPDFAGFILAEGFKRTITREKAKELKALLNPDIKAVGVFVNDDIEKVSDFFLKGTIDVIQLHGNEDEEYIRKLREKCNLKVTEQIVETRDKNCSEADNDSESVSLLPEIKIIKVFKIDGQETVQKANKSSADMLLLDSGTGTGKVFDWDLLKNIKRPFILAGGLSCDNIEKALKTVNPYGVDVSSGIETDGVKDRAKIERFVASVRGVI